MNKILMNIKKSLTKVNHRGIGKGMKATCTPCKKSCSHTTQVVTLNNEKYCIVPKSVYDGILETIAIMSDPEAHRKLQEAFADPEKMMFHSVDDMLKYFEVERD
jgi:PHD/YefM family antitoxin component YafN of YafNO toxin-antitoxin module